MIEPRVALQRSLAFCFAKSSPSLLVKNILKASIYSGINNKLEHRIERSAVAQRSRIASQCSTEIKLLE